MSLDKVWNRIIDWHKVNAPGKLVLAPGASKKSVDAFEAKIGLKLPDDVRESYMLHNGAENYGGSLYHSLTYHGDFLPLDKILLIWTRYREWQEKDGYGTRQKWSYFPELKGPIKKGNRSLLFEGK